MVSYALQVVRSGYREATLRYVAISVGGFDINKIS